MAGSMMFWRFGGYANISSIDTILDKPDCTLEEVLDESDVEQELKTQNAKLIEFLRDEAILRKLLKYVIAPKPVRSAADPKTPAVEEEKSKAVGFFKSRSKVRSKSRGDTEDTLEAREEKWRRYSYVSTQLLSSEVWSIVESLLEYPELLREFWDYIKADPELDNMQAGNFSIVNEFLLDKKPVEMAAFFRTIDGIVDNMIKHVNCPVVMDLLLKIISLEKDSAPGIVDWLQSEDLVPKLMSFITPAKSPTVQTAAGDFLKAIITISANATGQDASVIGPNELTRQLVSETCLNQLLVEMMQGGNPLTVGVGIIIEVIRKNNSDYDQDTQIGPEPKSSDPIFLGTLLRIFSNHIGDFMDLILSPKHTIVTDDGAQQVVRKELSTAWGARIEPLGFDRFKTCELMAELLHCSNMGLLNEKNAEAEVERRDAERERLKAEGRLAAQRRPEANTEAFGASVDSHGFHHAEAHSPLGESPEKIPTPDTTSTGLEEEFEKVDLTDMPSKESSPTSPRPSLSERRSSLLTQQIQREKERAMGPQADSSTTTIDDSDKPAPLFSKRDESPQAKASDVGVSTVEMRESEPRILGQIETKDGPHAENQMDDEGEGSPVVGDLLKMKFVEHRVVPTIIDFFFRFPWNNFLHNVVYDVVQQVFNGAMDKGYNKHLAIDLFETGCVTERVVDGQRRSDDSQQKHKMRLGYMGHLTLIAEEVVKFTDRQPADTLAQLVVDKISSPAWKDFVEHTLTETRERDNAILGGVRPDNAVGPRQAVLNAVNAANNASFGEGNAIGGTGGPGLDSLDLTNASIANFGLNSGNSNQLLRDFNNSDDEDEDVEIGGIDGAASTKRRVSIDDEDQTNLDDAEKPAPLSLPPMDRAKRTFLRNRRKASKGSAKVSSLNAAIASSDGEFVEEPESSSSQQTATKAAPGATGLLIASSGLPSPGLDARTTATDADFPDVDASYGYSRASQSGFEDDFTGFGSDEGEDGSSDDDEMRRNKSFNDDDDDEDEHRTLPLRRQSTTEALERRPLDEGSNSSDEEEDESSDNDAVTPTASIINTPSEQHVLPQEDAKKMEQDKLLKRWGFDDDSDDDDDEPVSMGSKYLPKRRTES